MAEDEPDEPEWTLDSLRTGESNEDFYPNATTTRRLVAEYRRLWTWHPRWRRGGGDTLTMTELYEWLGAPERLDTSAERVDFRTFEESFRLEVVRLVRLNTFCFQNRIDCIEALVLCANVIHGAYDHFADTGRMLHNANPSHAEWRANVPKEMHDPAVIAEKNENALNYDEAKLTPFQNAFLRLCARLQGLNWRRASGKFFERVTSKAGAPMLVFREVMDIKTFVYNATDKDSSFKLFTWATASPHNTGHLIDALTERPLSAAPDLVTDRRLRTYGGDAVGRGSGVYDCLHDMFFPYAHQGSWDAMAQLVTNVRRRHDRAYKCVAPTTNSVCVIHLDVPFPYDIYDEQLRRSWLPPAGSWRLAEPYECTTGVLANPALGQLLEDRMGDGGDVVGPVVWGLVWHAMPDDAPRGAEWKELAEVPLGGRWVPAETGTVLPLDRPELTEALRDGVRTFADDVDWRVDDPTARVDVGGVRYRPVHGALPLGVEWAVDDDPRDDAAQGASPASVVVLDRPELAAELQRGVRTFSDALFWRVDDASVRVVVDDGTVYRPSVNARPLGARWVVVHTSADGDPPPLERPSLAAALGRGCLVFGAADVDVDWRVDDTEERTRATDGIVYRPARNVHEHLRRHTETCILHLEEADVPPGVDGTTYLVVQRPVLGTTATERVVFVPLQTPGRRPRVRLTLD